MASELYSKILKYPDEPQPTLLSWILAKARSAGVLWSLFCLLSSRSSSVIAVVVEICSTICFEIFFLFLFLPKKKS